MIVVVVRLALLLLLLLLWFFFDTHTHTHNRVVFVEHNNNIIIFDVLDYYNPLTYDIPNMIENKFLEYNIFIKYLLIL